MCRVEVTYLYIMYMYLSGNILHTDRFSGVACRFRKNLFRKRCATIFLAFGEASFVEVVQWDG